MREPSFMIAMEDKHSAEQKRMKDALKTVLTGNKIQTPDGKKHTIGELCSKARKAGEDLIIIDSCSEYAPVKRKFTGSK